MPFRRLLAALLLHSLAVSLAGQDKPGGFSFVPILFYTPETSIAAGASPLYLFPADARTRQSSLIGVMIYTLENQAQGFATWTHHFRNNSASLKTTLDGKHFPSKFYGLGDATRDDDEEHFLEDSLRLETTFLLGLGRALKLGIRLEHESLWVREKRPGGLLDAGGIPGADGSHVTGLGLQFSRDTTDDAFYPLRGSTLTGSLTRYTAWPGQGHTAFLLDARAYLPLGPRHVLALQLLADVCGGAVPFNRLPELGGAKLLRGYYEGRFREKNLLALQGEFRSPLYKRFGFALFAGTGAVAREFSGLAQARWKWTAGAGLRFRLRRDSRLNLRLDVAGNHETFGVYFLGLEAF